MKHTNSSKITAPPTKTEKELKIKAEEVVVMEVEVEDRVEEEAVEEGDVNTSGLTSMHKLETSCQAQTVG